MYHHCCVQSSDLSQKEKSASAIEADLKEQLEGVRYELANSMSLSDSLKQDLEQVREREREKREEEVRERTEGERGEEVRERTEGERGGGGRENDYEGKRENTGIVSPEVNTFGTILIYL